MSTPYVVITRPGVVNAPYTYALAAGESFQPETVTATFDCTGAAGACLPCLSVYSANGVLLGRFKADQVAAGDTAEVTWAPFLGAGAGTGATQTAWLRAARGTVFTLPAASDTTIPFTTIKTSDSTILAMTTQHGQTNDTVIVSKPGIVLSSVQLNPTAPTTWKVSVICNGDNEEEMGVGGANFITDAGADLTPAGNHNDPRDYRLSVGTASPFYVYPVAHNYEAVDHTLAFIEFGVFWWSNATLFV